MFESLKRRLLIAFITFIVICLLLIIIIEITLQPVLHSVCKTKVTSMLVKMINRAINHQTDTISYNDLVMIQTNSKGQIILMQPNLQVVNDLSSNITLELQKRLDQKNNKFIRIPISQMFGIEVLSKFGPDLTAKIIPYGSTTSRIIDSFESVGINQSRHKIYLKVNTNVKVMLPLLSTDIKVSTNVPLSEAVIVGQVPEVYVGVDDGVFKSNGIKDE